MSLPASRSRTFAYFVVVLLLAGTAGCSRGQPKAAKALPQPTVDAWAQGGAQAGWVRRDSYGRIQFIPASATIPIGGGFHSGGGPIYPGPRGGDQAGDLPGFRITLWREGVVAKLPPPSQPCALYLGATDLTDAALQELAGLQSLQALDLWGTPVTDAGLKHLAGLKALQTLSLQGTKITAAGLKELAELKDLQALNLRDTALIDSGLKELAALKGLQALDLHQTRISDAGLQQLAELKNLQALDLSETKVTDLGLKELASWKGLQRLDLADTQVTAAGLKELKTALPNCEISQ